MALGVTLACGSSGPNDLGLGNGSGSPASDDSGATFGIGNGGMGNGGGSSGGVFASSGDAGSDSGGPMPITVTSVDTCNSGAPSGLSATSVKALLAGGSAGSMRFLDPYSGTVFPRGLIAPTLMWDGASADYVYVHLKSKVFEYKGCLVPTATGQILLPQTIWEAASAHAVGASDPFSLSLTTIASGTVTGPITEPLVIAPATLKGSIYYNSYTSKLVTGLGGGGAVLRIVPGQNVTLFLGASGCTGCHAVSANGSRMVADPLMMGGGATYTLTPQGAANPAPLVSNAPNATFVGVYPDGSLYVGNAHPNNGVGGPRSGGPGSIGPVSSGLYETDTGNAVSNSGIPSGAMMSTFSPDGTLLAFTDTAIGNGDGQGLAMMSFDKSGRTAGAYKKLQQVTDSSTYPGWPFFLPDNGGIVFAIGNQSDFSGGGLGLGLAGAVSGVTSDLYLLDIASGTVSLLASAAGFASAADAASNTTYLPYSAGDELHHNFYPTVSPVAAGGYFLGLLRFVPSLWQPRSAAAALGHGRRHLFRGKVHRRREPPRVLRDGPRARDWQSPGLHLLDPCRANGSTCSEGEDCCGGYCTNGTCGLPPSCSNIDDACSATQKCCDATLQCIGGFCAQVIK